MITLLLRQNDVATSFWWNNDVTIASCVRWDRSTHGGLCQVNSLLTEAETNGRYNADDIFKCIFLNENVWFPTKISLKFVPKGPINNIQALVLIMAWRRPGDKPLSEPMMVRLPTHICVTRPQWVKPSTAGPIHIRDLNLAIRVLTGVLASQPSAATVTTVMLNTSSSDLLFLLIICIFLTRWRHLKWPTRFQEISRYYVCYEKVCSDVTEDYFTEVKIQSIMMTCDLEIPSASLSLYVWNPSVTVNVTTGGFPTQRASDLDRWWCLCCQLS